jgi:hypothetical protein
MLKGSMLVLGVATTLLMAAPAPSHAQGVYIGPGGVGIDTGVRGYRDRRDSIGRREAADIAREHGMKNIDSVDRRDDVYVVRGWDWRGDRMRVTINAYNGRVLDIRRRD